MALTFTREQVQFIARLVDLNATTLQNIVKHCYKPGVYWSGNIPRNAAIEQILTALSDSRHSNLNVKSLKVDLERYGVLRE